MRLEILFCQNDRCDDDNMSVIDHVSRMTCLGCVGGVLCCSCYAVNQFKIHKSNYLMAYVFHNTAKNILVFDTYVLHNSLSQVYGLLR